MKTDLEPSSAKMKQIKLLRTVGRVQNCAGIRYQSPLVYFYLAIICNGQMIFVRYNNLCNLYHLQMRQILKSSAFSSFFLLYNKFIQF